MTKTEIKNAIKLLKSGSGTHSPSIATIKREIPEIKISTDACFLSNPYATDLFMGYLKKDLIETDLLRLYLEFYPPQNREVAKNISNIIGVPYQNIFVGNGAIEIIQAVMHRFLKKKVCVIIPTFSSYYEFLLPGVELIFYKLQKDNDYNLDVENFIDFVKANKPDSIVIINPNNPNGLYVQTSDLQHIVSELDFLENIIIDESFIHFAYEDDKHSLINYYNIFSQNNKVILVKSMSKDFGVAGLRAGYAIMNAEKVSTLLNNGYLWNVSGLADYFFKTYSDVEFQKKYEIERLKYLKHTSEFYNNLKNINGVKVLESKANFFLLEILAEQSSFDFCMDLLVDHEVYARDCSDKIGLDGKYVRIASRTQDENLIIAQAIKSVIS